ncbi:Spo0E family sporulation regulatory protein-aspartic acid phosphatase [Clostridium sp.]|uniref:Spo0E family sporulation regulatory protein-aspartic acid phosphatase n=1 Tax=Clostridium sp. TaxID=1506 RepID=UPI0026113131|nr:Spo0E family sporulation regulatory protein-aspartic acid phosphatase [Clostridium sp.]
MEVRSSKDKIEELRELVNTIIVSENYDADYLIKKSRELDILIVQALKEMNFAKKIFGNRSISEFYEFDIMLDKIKRFEKNYNSMRIVDPITKEVLEIKKDELYKVDNSCYKFFKKESECQNCISRRACDSDDILMKRESFDEKEFIVTAVPIFIHGKRLSVELFKDVSNNEESI